MSITEYNPSDDVLCDKCGHVMQREITAVSFQLAGSGWFKDGY